MTGDFGYGTWYEMEEAETRPARRIGGEGVDAAVPTECPGGGALLAQ